MKLFRRLDELTPEVRGGAVTIGNFDGVHRGHARIIERLKRRAEACGGPAVVFTFDPHPITILRPDSSPPPLTWFDRKIDLLASLGVDAVLAYATDRELLGLAPDEFFRRIVCDSLGARAMVEGPNFFFGRDRAGTIETLATCCRVHGVSLEIVPAETIDGAIVSSSRIRTDIATGDVADVRRLLTEPYRIRGVVSRGAGRGASIGFPTANLESIETLVPADGVFAGRAFVGDAPFAAAINIGPNPTFGEDRRKVEVHLLDHEGSLYGRALEVEFLERLRPTRPFDSVDSLIAQLQSDVAATRRICSASG